MKNYIIILIITIVCPNLFAQQTLIEKSDSLFFNLNENYIKRISVDYGSKKDRLYLLAEPKIQANIFFEIDTVCFSEKSINTVKVEDLKSFLRKHSILTNDDNLYVSVGKLFRALKPYCVYFVDNKLENQKLYRAILIKEEI